MLLLFVSKGLRIPALRASEQVALQTLGAHVEPLARGEHKHLWTSAS